MLRRKQNTGKKLAIGAALGSVLGYAAGILTAPKSGKETREELSTKAGEVKNSAAEQLEKSVEELNVALESAKTKSVSMNAKARSEFNETVVKAKDAQNKAGQVLKAFRAGEAENPELNRAVKQAKLAIRNLGKYLKS
jgi:gas vesicle protein